jgi:hypothetical protein
LLPFAYEVEEVMNRLWSKASGWSNAAAGADSDGTTTATDSKRTSSFPSSSSSSSSPPSSWTYWDYANSTMSNAAEATYSLFPSVPPLSWPSSLGTTTAASTTTIHDSSSTNSMEKTTYRPASSSSSSLLGLWADRVVTKKAEHTATSTDGSLSFRRLIRSGSSSSSSYNNNMSWMRNNPYNSVRGHRHGGYRQSMSAVRSFLTVAPVEESNDNNNWQHHQPKIPEKETTGNDDDDDETTLAAVSHALMSDESLLNTTTTRADEGGGGGGGRTVLRRQRSGGSTGSLTQHQSSPAPSPSFSSKSKQNSLTACHVAEGTIRALRDLLLDEAVELNAALRFWSDRWERPLVSWLEAGPLGKLFIFTTHMNEFFSIFSICMQVSHPTILESTSMY